MTPAQRDLLMKVIDAYAGLMAADIAADRLAKIKAAGIENVAFAWAGPVERGQRHYYRVQGPTFLIEFDNTQNNGNHVHSIWRDFKGDFGRDLLREHLKTAHLGTGSRALVRACRRTSSPASSSSPRRRCAAARRRQRPPADHRSLRACEVDGPGDCRAAGAALRARARAGRHGAARRAVPADRVVLFVHGAGTPAEVAFDVPYQDYSWMAYLARAGLRRLLCRHDRLRPFHPPRADERSVQRGRDRQADWIPIAAQGAVRAVLSAGNDDDRLRLGRHRRGGGLHPRAPARRAREPGGVVARRPARRRLCRPASAEGESAGAARPCLQPHQRRGPPAKVPAEGAAFNTQSRAELDASGQRQTGCADAGRSRGCATWSGPR